MPGPFQANHSLLPLLQTQVALLDDLISLGNQQLQAIELGRMSELLSLLAEKQPLLTQLSDTANQLRYCGDPSAANSTMLPEDREVCRKQKAVASERFDELLTLEKQCESALCSSRDQIARRLEASAHSMNAATAYQGNQLQVSQGGRLDLSSS